MLLCFQIFKTEDREERERTMGLFPFLLEVFFQMCGYVCAEGGEEACVLFDPHLTTILLGIQSRHCFSYCIADKTETREGK